MRDDLQGEAEKEGHAGAGEEERGLLTPKFGKEADLWAQIGEESV
jgi:hypothetical protein